MSHIHGSYNSRFFAVHDGTALALHRGPTLLWSRPVPGVREVLRVGNQGDTYFRTEDGVARLAHSKESVLEPLSAVKELLKGEDEPRLGTVRVNAEGTEVCLERITTESRLSRKLLGILRRGQSAETEPPLESHEILILNRASGNFRKFFKGLVDPDRKGRFLWDVSPNFAFLVVGVPEKKGTILFKVIHTKEETVYAEFDMKFADIPHLWVTDNGTVLLDVRVSAEESYLVLSTLEGEKHVLKPPAGYEVLHLGHRVVAMKTSPVPFILVKSFEDALVCHADLRPLERLGLIYEVMFNERGDIDLVTLKGSELRVNHTDVETLAVDAKRWDLLAQQQEWAEHEQVQQQQVKEQEEESKRRRHEERSRQLAHDIPAALAPARANADLPDDQPKRTRAEIESELERLRMHYISGALDRVDYLAKVEVLNRELQGAPAPEPGAAEAAEPSLPPVRTPERLEVPSSETRAVAAPARATQVMPWDSEPMPTIRRIDPKEFERQKVERLLESLEERLVLGELSEPVYRELKEKYLRRLADV